MLLRRGLVYREGGCGRGMWLEYHTGHVWPILAEVGMRC